MLLASPSRVTWRCHSFSQEQCVTALVSYCLLGTGPEPSCPAFIEHQSHRLAVPRGLPLPVSSPPCHSGQTDTAWAARSQVFLKTALSGISIGLAQGPVPLKTGISGGTCKVWINLGPVKLTPCSTVGNVLVRLFLLL